MFISGFCRTIGGVLQAGTLLDRTHGRGLLPARLDEEVLKPDQFLLPALAVPAGDVGFVGALDDPDQRPVTPGLGELDPQFERYVGVDAGIAGDPLPGHEDVGVEELGVDAVGAHSGARIVVAHLEVIVVAAELLLARRLSVSTCQPGEPRHWASSVGSVHARKTCSRG